MNKVASEADRAPCVGCGSSSCRVLYARYLRGPAGPRVACDQPVRVVSVCGFERIVDCQTSNWAKCPHCAYTYQRRLRRVIDSGFTRHAGRHTYLLTLTAPGDGPHKRWVPKSLYRKGMRRPDCDCEAADLGAWNRSAGECWNRFRTSLRRTYPSLEFCRVAEVQERGALHHHVLVVTVDQLLVDQLQLLALAAGYGCVVDLAPVLSGKGLEGYLTKTLGGYVTKSVMARQTVPWAGRRERLDRQTGEITDAGPACPTFRTHSESRGWGLTMKAVRQAAREHVRRQASLDAVAPTTDSPTAAGAAVSGVPPD